MALARAGLGLPYFRAHMSRSAEGPRHSYRSERAHPGAPPAAFDAAWTVGEPVPDAPGSLDAFLAERYALYTAHAGLLLRVRVRHPAWELREARVERLAETVVRAAGLEPLAMLPARHSAGVDVELLVPEVVEGPAAPR